MKKSELEQRLNQGMVIVGYKIVSHGSDSDVSARRDLIDSHTFVGEYGGFLFGIRPVSIQRPNALSVMLDIKRLTIGDSGLAYVPEDGAEEAMADLRSKIAAAGDADLIETFKSLGLKHVSEFLEGANADQ